MTTASRVYLSDNRRASAAAIGTTDHQAALTRDTSAAGIMLSKNNIVLPFGHTP
jgi:hypothetical protein